MAISEQVTLDTSQVISEANKAAGAIGKLSAALKELGNAKASSSAVSEIEAKGSIQLQIQRQRDLAASVMAAQKARVAQEMQSAKIVAQSQMSQQKAVQAAILAAQKSTHAQRLAQIKEEAAAKRQIVAIDAKAQADAIKAENHRLELIKREQARGSKPGGGGNRLPNAGGGGGAAGFGSGGNGAIDSMVSAAGGEAAIVQAVAQKLQEMLSTIVGLVHGGLALSLAAQDFKDNALDSFEILLGGEKAAKQMYDKIEKLSHTLGISKERAMGETKRLLAAGYKQDQIPKMLESIADLDKTRDGGGAKFEKILENIKGKGKLDKGAISQLGKLGIGEADVYAALAKQQKKSVDEVKALVKRGAIDANQGIEVVLNAAQAKFGGRAKKDAEDVLTLVMTVKSQLVELFEDVNIAPIQQFLKNVRDLLDSGVGKELKAAMSGLFSDLFTLLFGGLKDKGDLEGFAQGITGALKNVSQFIREITPGIHGFIKGLKTGFKQAEPALSALAKAFLAVTSASGGWGGFWEKAGQGVATMISLLAGIVEVIAIVVGAFLMIVGVVAGAINAVIGFIQDLLAWIGEALGEFGVSGEDIGEAIVDGLLNAILLGNGPLFSAIVDLVDSAITAAKEALGIHSPSRVFAEIGDYTTQGMAVGIDGGVGNVTGAVNRMAAKTSGAAVGVPSAAAAGASAGAQAAANGNSGVGIHIEHLEIHANDAAGGAAAAEAFKRGLTDFARRTGTQGS